MVNKSGAKGSLFERQNVDFWGLFYRGARRFRNDNGRYDMGDFHLPNEKRFIVQCKHWSRFSISQWHNDAQEQAKNAGLPFGVVLHKRRGSTKPRDQWVTLDAEHFWILLDTLPEPHDGVVLLAATRKSLNERALGESYNRDTAILSGFGGLGIFHKKRGKEEYWLTMDAQTFLWMAKGKTYDGQDASCT